VVDAAGRPVAKVEIEATATDGLDTSYSSPRTLTNDEGRFDLGPIRQGVYRVRPDTTYGINQANDPQGDVKLVEVKDQQDADVGDIRYTGPKPSLTPEQEAGMMRQIGHGPPVPGGAVSRRPVAPATRPAAAPAPGTGIVPADLVPDVAKAYRLGPTDLVEITVLDPTGPGVKATTSARVSPAGTVRLPLVGEVKIAGLTEVEAVDAVAKAYADKRVIANAQVTVSVTENRGNAFVIVGPSVAHAGQYPVPGPNYRLSEALSTAGAVDKATTVKLVRGAGKDQRVIEVPASAVLAGDRGVNVVVRPGDMILVAGPEQKFVRVVVGKDAITLDGKAVDAAGIDRALDAIPPADRPRTTVQVAAAAGDVPVGRFMQVFATCVNKARAIGLPPVSNVGVEPERPTSAPGAAGK
jgi:polysaccharide export outer membrane protein